MSPLFLAVRAISSEFARRIYLPVAWIGGGVLVALLFIAGWLTAMSAWWTFLLVPVVVLLLLFLIVAAIIGVVIQVLRPLQSKDQQIAVGALVDKLQKVSEALQMPKTLLLIRLAKDTLFPSGESFIREMVSHAVTLKPDFQEIVASFDVR